MNSRMSPMANRMKPTIGMYGNGSTVWTMRPMPRRVRASDITCKGKGV